MLSVAQIFIKNIKSILTIEGDALCKTIQISIKIVGFLI